MAGDWIKVRTNLGGDPAVKSIARELRETAHSVVGRLHALWSWADQHTDDGALDFTVLTDIDDIVEKRGFAAQMVRVGWLIDRGADGVCIPNWERHNGRSAKKRCLDSEAQRRKRESHTDINRTMSENDSDKKRQTPDQRREEKNNTPIVPASGDGAPSASAGKSEDPNEDPLLLRAKAIFRMRPGTPLDRGLARAWSKAAPAVTATLDSEWSQLEAYYAAEIPERDDFRRRDLATLLNNWTTEITRAWDWCVRTGWHAENSEKKEKGPPAPPEGEWRDALKFLREYNPAVLGDLDISTVRTWSQLSPDVQAAVLKAIADAENEVLSQEDAA